MKKFMLLAALLWIIPAVAQDKIKINLVEVNQSSNHSSFVFEIPNNLTKENCESLFKPYANYLELKFDKNNRFIVRLKEEKEINKRVVQRFLMNMNVGEVNFNGKALNMDSDIIKWNLEVK